MLLKMKNINILRSSTNLKNFLCAFVILHLLLLSNNSSAQKWHPLFDGKTMNGWETRDANSPIEVKDGTMIAYHRDTTGHTYLSTTDEFKDFILDLEVKVVGDLNSGILLRGISSPEIHQGKVHGYQMEIDQSERQWTGGIYEELGRGWLYSLENRETERKAYRPSEWNHYRIEVIKDTFKIWVNDKPVLHMIDSKTRKGVIAFQIHDLAEGFNGGTVEIRNMNILTKRTRKYSRVIALAGKVIE